MKNVRRTNFRFGFFCCSIEPLASSKFSSALTLAGLLGLAVLCGYLLGRLLTHVAAPEVTIKQLPDERAGVPVVQLSGVQDGNLQGTIIGDVRFFLGDEQISPKEDGTIASPVGSFFTNEVVIRVPEGMQFVASKQGKYYYPVLSANGEKLVPANRVYFRTAADAEKAGFKHP